MKQKTAILLTGRPGIGKTTIVKRVAKGLQGQAGGFYTVEIREGGLRQGFRIVTMQSATGVLAHVSHESPYRVGKYGVDVDSLNKVGVAAILNALENSSHIIIDEIGKMELFSLPFREATLKAVESGKWVLGTIMQGFHPWADGIKAHPRVEILTVNEANRDRLPEELLTTIALR